MVFWKEALHSPTKRSCLYKLLKGFMFQKNKTLTNPFEPRWSLCLLITIKNTLILAPESAFRCLQLCKQMWNIFFIFPSKENWYIQPKRKRSIPPRTTKRWETDYFPLLPQQAVTSGVNVFVLMPNLFCVYFFPCTNTTTKTIPNLYVVQKRKSNARN